MLLNSRTWISFKANLNQLHNFYQITIKQLSSACFNTLGITSLNKFKQNILKQLESFLNMLWPFQSPNLTLINFSVKGILKVKLIRIKLQI